MPRILVSGLINLETTLAIDNFPLDYFPVTYPFNGVNSTVSGVGYNVALILATLGDTVDLVSLTGSDPAGSLSRSELEKRGVSARYSLENLDRTPQSVIIFEKSGRRQIHVDLKNIQETEYPDAVFAEAAEGCDAFAMCNINFSRRHLEAASRSGKPVATDIHAISDIYDNYNRDFMEAADVLFLSDERLPCSPREWAEKASEIYDIGVVAVGMGARGAFLLSRSEGISEYLPAVTVRPVVNTIGAGDALFASFLHFFVSGAGALASMKKAMAFAAYKIGANGGAEGFATLGELERICAELGI